MFDLKPCPFCGCEVGFDSIIEPHKHTIAPWLHDVKGYTAFITCGFCGAAMSGEECKTEQEAKESVLLKWNKRLKLKGE